MIINNLKKESANLLKWAYLLIAALTLLLGYDVFKHLIEQAPLLHLFFEAVMLSILITTLILIHRYQKITKYIIVISSSELDQAKEETTHWRKEMNTLVTGLAINIQEQFKRWNLSLAEAHVGMLLIKGLSLKEIADFRSTSERTVRQQAISLYKKAGVSGRNELSAYFLEDLLLPSDYLNKNE